MTNLLISVITTVKNGELFVLETLKSVKNQTFKNFEHIIVDDGSTDNTVNIIKKFQENHPNYKLHLFQPGSLGRGRALNYAISKAKSDWIAIIDGDDLWHPHKLDLQYNYIKTNKFDVLATKTQLFERTENVNFEKKNELNTLVCFKKKQLLKSNEISHSSVLIRKELCRYDENRESQFDYELWLRLISNKKELVLLTNVLNYHRIHSNQSFESKMGRAYSWRAYKLNILYALKFGETSFVFYSSAKFLLRMVFSKKQLKVLKSKLK